MEDSLAAETNSNTDQEWLTSKLSVLATWINPSFWLELKGLMEVLCAMCCSPYTRKNYCVFRDLVTIYHLAWAYSR
jgi:hypothetical protein